MRTGQGPRFQPETVVNRGGRADQNRAPADAQGASGPGWKPGLAKGEFVRLGPLPASRSAGPAAALADFLLAASAHPPNLRDLAAAKSRLRLAGPSSLKDAPACVQRAAQALSRLYDGVGAQLGVVELAYLAADVTASLDDAVNAPPPGQTVSAWSRRIVGHLTRGAAE